MLMQSKVDQLASKHGVSTAAVKPEGERRNLWSVGMGGAPGRPGSGLVIGLRLRSAAKVKTSRLQTLADGLMRSKSGKKLSRSRR